MDRRCKGNRYPWLCRLAQATALSALLTIGITWAGSIVDHPIDTAITAGMTSPACAEVRAMAAGSLLSASLPNNDVCRSFFLYRATFSDAAADAGAYATSVMQDRIDEFWQLIGYVGVLSLAVVGTTFALATAARIAYRRKRRVA
ncbi:hypothetical protein SAMN05414139_09654 [Burkholderia sp. D7]|nr:hypothetical protein SAMN05414139_09654 [Burkholderia sp. D7]